MNYYKCSNGDRVSKAEIDMRVREAKKNLITNQYAEEGYNFCQICVKEGIPDATLPGMEVYILDCMHIESVDSCQKNGHAEKAWDLNNMQVACRYHHKIHDGLNLKFKQ